MMIVGDQGLNRFPILVDVGLEAGACDSEWIGIHGTPPPVEKMSGAAHSTEAPS
jgi:hypothetical protein